MKIEKLIKGKMYELVDGSLGCDLCPFQQDDDACCEAGYDCLHGTIDDKGQWHPVVWREKENENA